MTAYPAGGAPSGISWTNYAVAHLAYPNPSATGAVQSHADWDKAPIVYTKKLILNYSQYYGKTYDSSYTNVSLQTLNWSQGGGGSDSVYWTEGLPGTVIFDASWQADPGCIQSLPAQFYYYDIQYGHLYKETNFSSSSWPYFRGNRGHDPRTYYQSGYGNGVYHLFNSSGGVLVPAYIGPVWSEAMQQVVALFTGGKAARQTGRLFALSQTLNYDQGGDGFGYDYGVETLGFVPQPQIALADQGTLGNDGNLNKVYASGQNVVITPRTAQVYTSVSDNLTSQQDITPVITANGIALSNSVVSAGANFCVGQEVQFGLNLPAGVTATNFQWGFDGTYYNAQTLAVPEANFPMCSWVSYVDTNLLTYNVSTNWWMTGGVGENTNPNIPAQYKASVSCDLIFANGNPTQHINNVSGLFNMYRPKAYITTKTGAIAIDANYFFWTNIISGGVTNEVPGLNVFALHFGIPSNPYGTYSTNGAPGIVFSNSTITPASFTGKVKWVQVVNKTYKLLRHASNPNYEWDSPPVADIRMPMLDTFYPYPSDPGDPTTEDSPAQSAIPQSDFSGILCTEEFSMWLMFRADAGSHDVPLCKVDWSWSAVAAWSLSGTNWELAGPTNTINPTGTDCIILPYWEANVDIMNRH